MKRNWEADELIESFTLLPKEMELLANKTGSNRLGFALLLKFFQYSARFPRQPQEVPKPVLAYIAQQVGVPAELYQEYDWRGRTIKSHRVQIREFLGFRQATVQDAQDLADWLCQYVSRHNCEIEPLKTLVYQRFRDLKIEPPTPNRVERLVRSAIRTYEEHFFAAVVQKLPPEALVQMDALLGSAASTSDGIEGLDEPLPEKSDLPELKTDPGRIGLDSVLKEITKLQRLRHLGLPTDLFKNVSPKVLQTYRQRVAAESLHNIRRHPEPIRYGCVAKTI